MLFRVRCQKREAAVQFIIRGLKCQLFTRPGYQVFFRHVSCTEKVSKKNTFYEHTVSFPVTARIWNFGECGEPAASSIHRSGVLFQGIANGK